MDEAALFKFGKWIDYSKSHPSGKKFHPEGAWSGSPCSLNFANASTMASATPGVKNSPETGVVSCDSCF